MHKDIYTTGQKLPKRDKLGIHAVAEGVCVKALALAVKAAFQSRQTKLKTLESLRVKVEMLKHLIRTEQELGVVKEKTYMRLAEHLVEISKMTNGWILYTQNAQRAGHSCEKLPRENASPGSGCRDSSSPR